MGLGFSKTRGLFHYEGQFASSFWASFPVRGTTYYSNFISCPSRIFVLYSKLLN